MVMSFVSKLNENEPFLISMWTMGVILNISLLLKGKHSALPLSSWSLLIHSPFLIFIKHD